jgi:hypothetical protein
MVEGMGKAVPEPIYEGHADDITPGNFAWA